MLTLFTRQVATRELLQAATAVCAWDVVMGLQRLVPQLRAAHPSALGGLEVGPHTLAAAMTAAAQVRRWVLVGWDYVW